MVDFAGPVTRIVSLLSIEHVTFQSIKQLLMTYVNLAGSMLNP